MTASLCHLGRISTLGLAGLVDRDLLPAGGAGYSQEDIDIAVLATKVSHDQALTAKTLRLANSSAYGLRVKVTTIEQAITYMGFQATRNVITTAALTGCFTSERCKGFKQLMRLGITGHHDPEVLGADFLAAIVHVADAIVHALNLSGEQDDLVPLVSAVAWNALGLSPAVYQQIFRENELQFAEISLSLLG